MLKGTKGDNVQVFKLVVLSECAQYYVNSSSQDSLFREFCAVRSGVKM